MRILLFLLILVFFCSCVYAQNISFADASISRYLTSNTYCNVSYDNLFKVSNEIYKTTGEKIIVSVNYSVFIGNVSFFSSFNKTINSYSRSKTGSASFPCYMGNATVCGSISVVSTESGLEVVDNNSVNNHICFNVTLSDPLMQNCSVSLGFDLESDVINQTKQKLYFSLTEKTYPYKIEYWVEDVFGNIVKKAYNTSNTNTKSFTPKVPHKLGFMGYVAKAQLSYIACNNSIDSSVVSLPFLALGVLPNKTAYALSSKSHVYEEGKSMRIRLQGYKHDTGKTALYVKIYDKHGKKISNGATFYIPDKNSWFDVEFKHVVPVCSELSSPITFVAEGLDYKTDLDVDIISSCKEVVEEEVIVPVVNESFSLRILSFYSMQKTVSPTLNLYSYIEGSGNVSIRVYGTDDGFERHMVEQIDGRKRVKISIPLLVKENESFSRRLSRHYILTVSDAHGQFDFDTMYVNLSQKPHIVKTVVEENISFSEKNTTSLITGAVVAHTLYEDKGFNAVRFSPLLLLVAQLAFVLKGRKLML